MSHGLIPAWLVLLAALPLPAQHVWAVQSGDQVVCTVRFPDLENHVAEIVASFPAKDREVLELLMPVWSPGFYRVEDHAGAVVGLTASAPEGQQLSVEKTSGNRWSVRTGGAERVVVTYRLRCESSSVTTNQVGPEFAVLNGSATWLAMAESVQQRYELRLKLPPGWNGAATGLEPAGDGDPGHFVAVDFDTLVDSPIMAGNLKTLAFDVDGASHELVLVGDHADWDAEQSVAELETLVSEHQRLWGGLPFSRYVFLCAFRRGGGGLEHANSTLLTASAKSGRSRGSNLSWLEFVSHEYFHAINVKRLRPVELGPFDYERPPRTSGLWIAEGITSYYDGLLLTRSGLATSEEFLAGLSDDIRQLQNSPGRLVQSLEQASLDAWTTSFSGIGGGDDTISYYVKGPVVAFLLDARIRQASGGAKTLDDLMRLACHRFSGAKGFTAEDFCLTASEVAGADLKPWFQSSIGSTEELDYSAALDWFGLEFDDDGGDAAAWRLTTSPDANPEQRERLRRWLEASTSE